MQNNLFIYSIGGQKYAIAAAQRGEYVEMRAEMIPDI